LLLQHECHRHERQARSKGVVGHRGISSRSAICRNLSIQSGHAWVKHWRCGHQRPAVTARRASFPYPRLSASSALRKCLTFALVIEKRSCVTFEQTHLGSNIYVLFKKKYKHLEVKYVSLKQQLFVFLLVFAVWNCTDIFRSAMKQ
jgi:hypothetical protein